jgi:hypothetical protein
LAKEAIKDFESRGAVAKSIGDRGQEQSLNRSFGGISNFCTAAPSRFIGSDQISALLTRFRPPREFLVSFGDLQHLCLRHGVLHLFGMDARLFGSRSPVLGIKRH